MHASARRLARTSPSASATSSARAPSSRARRSSSSPRRRASCGPGWAGAIDDAGTLVLERRDASEPRPGHPVGPLQRAERHRRGDGRAARPRRRTRRTSRSGATARPRCSTPHGRMVAQAEHIPVHLGAMPEAVAAVRERDPQPGDVFVLNDPFTRRDAPPRHHARLAAGRRGRGLGFAVTRAHHSDVGGMRPGSMPADSRDDLPGGDRASRRCGSSREGEVVDGRARRCCWPTSARPDVRRGDLRAQLAANRLRRAAPGRARRAPRAATSSLAAFDEVLRLRRAPGARGARAGCPTATLRGRAASSRATA